MSNQQINSEEHSYQPEGLSTFDQLADNWKGELVWREQNTLDRFAGEGVLNARTMANKDSMGQGPEGRVRIGKKVCYPKYNLAAWMKSQVVFDGSQQRQAS